jgi:CheY-like chemotaxis protein
MIEWLPDWPQHLERSVLMSQTRIFVSHSSQDNAFCNALVQALRGAGADVWYDEENLGAAHLLNEISRELASRPVFIVILSKAAFGSQWVMRECQWAYNLYTREPDRIILPVTAQPIEPSDFNLWLFLEDFRRIEAPGCMPLPQEEAISKTLHTLVLSPKGAPQTRRAPRTRESWAVLWVDDQPSNNAYERRSLEALGVRFTISIGTDDAIGKLVQHHYDAIISDMRRPPDDQAGFTLLEQVRKLRVASPFILYCGSRRPEHVAESKRRGAYGQTNDPDELIQLVTEALGVA